MSDYAPSLQNRLESLEAAHYEVDEALSDLYLDHQDERDLQKAKTTIEDVMARTEEELSVLDADWELVEEQADAIIDLLTEAAEMLEEAGLVNFHEDDLRLSKALANEPTAITDTRAYIDGAFDDWWEVRNAARDALDDQATSGGYHGGY